MEITFSFEQLPANLAELKALPEAGLKSPYETAALTVAALCSYERSKEDCLEMLNYLRGPKELSNYELQFLKDRLLGKAYKPFSYFAGASPENNYTPSEPFKLTVFASPRSFLEENYARLLLKSSGADSPREILLREKVSSGQWFLWENFLLADIVRPKTDDPWA